MNDYIKMLGIQFVTTFTVLSGLTASGHYEEVSTIAGEGTMGFCDGPALTAKFKMPHAITCDLLGNLYVADTYNDCIRKVDIDLKKVTTVGSNVVSSNKGKNIFSNPRGITCDSIGNLYVTDSYNSCICKIDAFSEEITTIAGNSFGFADGVGNVARFWRPYGITCDYKNNLYVVDRLNHSIRKLSLEKDGKTWQVVTIAGSGKAGWADNYEDGLKAQFNYPAGITCDNTGNLYVADTNNHCIRKIDHLGGVITIAGDGSFDFADSAISLNAKFYSPYGIACDIDDNLYVADSYNGRIRKIANDPVDKEYTISNILRG